MSRFVQFVLCIRSQLCLLSFLTDHLAGFILLQVMHYNITLALSLFWALLSVFLRCVQTSWQSLNMPRTATRPEKSIGKLSVFIKKSILNSFYADNCMWTGLAARLDCIIQFGSVFSVVSELYDSEWYESPVAKNRKVTASLPWVGTVFLIVVLRLVIFRAIIFSQMLYLIYEKNYEIYNLMYINVI